MSYCVFNSTIAGHNHIKTDKCCEDWSASHQDEKVKICIVADGHGSDNYPRTDRGSKFAVQAAMKCIKEFLDGVRVEDILGRYQEEIIILLEKSILSEWHTLVEKDFANEEFNAVELNNVSEKYRNAYLSHDRIEKAYGTTLIVFAISEAFSLGIQIGDGKCVIVDEKGNFSTPIPDDPNCQLNVTTSICDSDAIDEFRYYLSTKMPVAVFCGSDGVEDSYSSIEEVYALYRSIASIFVEYGDETGKNEVADYLPVLTKKGSGDDVSIAGIINMDLLKPLKAVFEIQSNLFKVNDELEKKNQRIKMLDERVITLKELLSQNAEVSKTMEEEHRAKNEEIFILSSESHNLEKVKEDLENKLRNLLENRSAKTQLQPCLTSDEEFLDVLNPRFEEATEDIYIGSNKLKSESNLQHIANEIQGEGVELVVLKSGGQAKNSLEMNDNTLSNENITEDGEKANDTMASTGEIIEIEMISESEKVIISNHTVSDENIGIVEVDKVGYEENSSGKTGDSE